MDVVVRALRGVWRVKNARMGFFVLTAGAIASVAQGQWAVEVVDFDGGLTGTPGFDNPATVLGEPERFTGESLFPGVVSPFNPAFGTDELVSIGEGGHLTVRFDRPINNDGSHLFGVDLIIFGSGGFVDSGFPDGVVGDPPGVFGTDEAQLELSVDGVDWVDAGMFTEGFVPAMGYADSGPFDDEPGSVLTDFTKPVDPSVVLDDFSGMNMEDLRAFYDGSGGGTGIDVRALVGADDGFMFARISVADDDDANTSLNAEVEGFAVVPAPGVCTVLVGGIALAGRRRRLT